MELEESTFLTSDYTKKLQSSRPYATGKKQKYRPMEKDKYGTGTEDSMVLAQKQKYRLVEQERNPRNKPMHLLLPYF